MRTISRTSATLVFSWFVFFSGVRSVDITAEEQTENTAVTTPHPKTKFILEIRIMNRIYNDSLEDQESEEYKTLRQEVEQLLFEVYGPTSLEYLGTDQITFSYGSVIVRAQLLFGTIMNDLMLDRNFFLSMYKQIPSPTLEIDLNYDTSSNSVDMFAVETTTHSETVTTVKPQTQFYMEIRISNRIYNDALEDQESEEYKTLRQEVEQLFSDVYGPLTSLQYVSADQITFRNGSVIAGADLLFGTTLINPTLEKSLFVTNYNKLTSPTLNIDLSYLANELPTQKPVEDITTPTPIPTTDLTTPHSTTTHPTTTHPTTTHPTTTHPTTTHPTTTSHTTTHPTTTPPTTMHPTTTHPTTTHPTTTSHTTTPTINSHTTNAPSTHPTSAHSSTHTTLLGSSTVNTTHSSTSLSPTFTPLNTTLNPDTNTSHSPINTTASTHNITSRTPTDSFISTASPSTSAAGVPGWGIALLVLAAICLFLIIILLIILLVMCCCWPNQTVVREPAVNPPMYFNPEIPMYSTHSTIDAANSQQMDVQEKPPKNRTGMYVVNK